MRELLTLVVFREYFNTLSLSDPYVSRNESTPIPFYVLFFFFRRFVMRDALLDFTPLLFYFHT